MKQDKHAYVYQAPPGEQEKHAYVYTKPRLENRKSILPSPY